MKHLLALLMVISATPALAHNGEHGHLIQWFGHMVTSSDHLLGLLGLTLFIGVIAGLRRIRRKDQRASER